MRVLRKSGAKWRHPRHSISRCHRSKPSQIEPPKYGITPFRRRRSRCSIRRIRLVSALSLVPNWIEAQGGIPEMRNAMNSKLQNSIPSSTGALFWKPQIDTASRSLMNVTWRIADEALESVFVKEAQIARACRTQRAPQRWWSTCEVA